MRIGERIGKPLRVDHATMSGARSDYARVCVQVDLTRPLLSQFTINGKKYFIQYEGLDKICLQCGTYFERARCSCMGRNEDMEVEEPVPTQTRTEPKQPEAVYGEWMIAKKKPRNRRPNPELEGESQEKRGVQVPGRDRQNGSRFNILEVEEIGGEGDASIEIREDPIVEERGKNKEKAKVRGKEKEGCSPPISVTSKTGDQLTVDKPTEQPPSDTSPPAPCSSPHGQIANHHARDAIPPSLGSQAVSMGPGKGVVGGNSNEDNGSIHEKPPDPRGMNEPKGDTRTRTTEQNGKLLRDVHGKSGGGLNGEAVSL
ncbi:unnamed protein product [Linum tenue]|uniref:Zinc knuckle CX2CX4HX4C domain-containing protein n=1 Tax=Linum tenue TaxID=586396 RepID=A0AAV0IYR2_9ROSI|nr:unnamed protein product [Linum tenue]